MWAAYGFCCPNGTDVGVHLGALQVLYSKRTPVLSCICMGGIVDCVLYDNIGFAGSE